MDLILICVLLLGVGLLVAGALMVIGQLLLLLTLGATVLLDLAANLSAMMVGHPRSRRG